MPPPDLAHVGRLHEAHGELAHLLRAAAPPRPEHEAVVPPVVGEDAARQPHDVPRLERAALAAPQQEVRRCGLVRHQRQARRRRLGSGVVMGRRARRRLVQHDERRVHGVGRRRDQVLELYRPSSAASGARVGAVGLRTGGTVSKSAGSIRHLIERIADVSNLSGCWPWKTNALDVIRNRKEREERVAHFSLRHGERSAREPRPPAAAAQLLLLRVASVRLPGGGQVLLLSVGLGPLITLGWAVPLVKERSPPVLEYGPKTG